MRQLKAVLAALAAAGLLGLGISSIAKADCVSGVFDPDLTGAMPADQTTYVAGSGTLAFALSGATPNMTVSVQVDTQPYLDDRGALSTYYMNDFFGLAEDPADGVYKGSAYNLPGSWTETPGTYYWQVQLFGNGTGYGCHMESSPVHELTVVAPAAPPPTPPPAPTPTPAPAPPSPPTVPSSPPKAVARYSLAIANARTWMRYATIDWLYHGRARTKLRRFRVHGCTQTRPRRIECRLSWRQGPYRWSGTLTVGSVNARTGAFSYGGRVARRGGTRLVRRGGKLRHLPARPRFRQIGYTNWTNGRPRPSNLARVRRMPSSISHR